MSGWLHAEISVRHWELNPDTVAHLSSNRARRRLTSLIEANALTTTPDHQTCMTLFDDDDDDDGNIDADHVVDDHENNARRA